MTGAGRLPIVGVMGSGSESHTELAEELGRWLARRGVHLLTGGGRGVMESVSRAFAETPGRAGVVIGMLPGDAETGEAPTGYPNEWVELVIRSHLPLSGSRGTDPRSRNHINVLTPDVIVALPGGAGTLSEVQLALRYETPIVAFLRSPDELPGIPESVPVAPDFRGVRDFVEEWLSSLSG